MALTPEQVRRAIKLRLERRMQGFPPLVPSRRDKTPPQSAESLETHEQYDKRLAESLANNTKPNVKAEQHRDVAKKQSATSVREPTQLDDCPGTYGILKRVLKNATPKALTVIDCGSAILVFPVLISLLFCCTADALRQVAKDIYGFIRLMYASPQDWVWSAAFIFASAWLAFRSLHDRKARAKISPFPQDR